MGHKSLTVSSQLWIDSDGKRDRKIGDSKRWLFLSNYMTNVKFPRPWLVYDSRLDADSRVGKFNWNFLLGIVLAVGISAGVWAGLGAAIAGALR